MDSEKAPCTSEIMTYLILRIRSYVVSEVLLYGPIVIAVAAGLKRDYE